MEQKHLFSLWNAVTEAEKLTIYFKFIKKKKIHH